MLKAGNIQSASHLLLIQNLYFYYAVRLNHVQFNYDFYDTEDRIHISSEAVSENRRALQRILKAASYFL